MAIVVISKKLEDAATETQHYWYKMSWSFQSKWRGCIKIQITFSL